MKFYIIERTDAPPYLVNTKAEAQEQAKEHQCTWSVEEVPSTDKEALRGYLNRLIARTQPEPSEAVSVEKVEGIVTTFNPAILEEQVEALGAKGMTGLDQLNTYQELQGVGVNFARGVILLCILAAGEHQLAKVFHKVRKT